MRKGHSCPRRLSTSSPHVYLRRLEGLHSLLDTGVGGTTMKSRVCLTYGVRYARHVHDGV